MRVFLTAFRKIMVRSANCLVDKPGTFKFVEQSSVQDY